MDNDEDYERLHGSQDLYIYENAICLGHTRALAQRSLIGTHVAIETAKSVDRRALGVAICLHGLSVLLAHGYIGPRTTKELAETIDDAIKENEPDEDGSVPF